MLLPRVCLLLFFTFGPLRAAVLDLKDGDRVVFLGDTLIEREQQAGWIETMLTARFGARSVTFRNLGWSADTPAGDARFGLSMLQAGKEPADEGWQQLVRQLEDAKPTVVFLGYGMASSFSGEAGLPAFRADYLRLLDTLERISPGVRLVLLSPLRHERLGSPWPDAAAHRAHLVRITDAVAQIAAARRAVFVSLDEVPAPASAALTANGIHPTATGYRAIAETLETALFGPAAHPWRTSPQTEALRTAIVRKNAWFFHRSRPANMAYIFGFRKKEQGKNAAEVLRFDGLIAAEEQNIARLRSLQQVAAPATTTRPAKPAAPYTPQTRPQFQVADGFEVTLWAENPLLHKPVQMNFDARGRLWVASSELYPQIEPGQPASDKIIILEDTTGSGRADQATVFADGLLIPTGLEVGDGGVYVAQSTELLHFRDTDGDGKADVRRTVLSGFGTEDTHHNLHTLRWGPDGRLYMNQSVYTRSDVETPHGVVRLKAGGVFRFDPRDQRMDIVYRGWVNAWGHQFDAFGQSFVTDGAGEAGINWGVPGATYRTLAPARRELQSVSPGRYPKFCGMEIMRSAHFPADWQGDLITCDFRAHRVVRFRLSEQGSGYVTEELPDVLRTTADSFRPIDVRLGPDGALYIADWSNPIIQHGEVDFRDPRRDKVHGRIWRVAAKGRAPLPRTDLTQLESSALLDRLVGPNAYEQEQARRVLIERGAETVLPHLTAWSKQHPADAEQLQALWLLQAFNLPQPDLLAASDPRVRAAAVRAGEGRTPLDRLEKLAADPHPRVRLEAVRALGRFDSVRSAEVALTALNRSMDPFLDYALWLTVNELAAPWLAAVKSGEWKIDGRERQLEFGLKAIEPALAADVLGHLVAARGVPRDGSGPWIELVGGAGGPPELRVLFEHVLADEFPPAVRLRAMAALTDAARLRGVRPSGELAPATKLLTTPDPALRLASIRMAGAWKLAPARTALVALAGDVSLAPAERDAVFAALRELGGDAVRDDLATLAAGPAPAIRREAVVALAALDLPRALPRAITLLRATEDEAEAQTLWRALLAVRGVSARLAEEFARTPPSAAVARTGLRPAREGTQHRALADILLASAGLTSSNAAPTAAEMNALAQEALARGDPARGELVYRRPELACVACHAIGGAGGKIGPDLTSIGASAPTDYLVEALLVPTAKIKEGYHSVLLTTRDGREVSGMIARETTDEILLRDAAGQQISLAVRDIAKRTSVGSLMPAGLVDALLPEERRDLVAFLARLGKPGDYDAAQGGIARAWKLYLVTAANQNLGIAGVVRGETALAEWKPIIARVSGALTPDLIATEYAGVALDRGLYAMTQFEAPRAGRIEFTVAGRTKGAWVNGQPVAAGARFAAEAKPRLNVIVLQLDTAELSAVTLRATGVSFSNDLP